MHSITSSITPRRESHRWKRLKQKSKNPKTIDDNGKEISPKKIKRHQMANRHYVRRRTWPKGYDSCGDLGSRNKDSEKVDGDFGIGEWDTTDSDSYNAFDPTYEYPRKKDQPCYSKYWYVHKSIRSATKTSWFTNILIIDFDPTAGSAGRTQSTIP